MQKLCERDSLIFDPPELGCVLSLTGLPGGGSKIYDRSPYCNHGTITGATWKRLPSGLWCLSFDGTDDYVNLGDKSAFDFGASDSLTLIAWVYPTAGSGYVIAKGQIESTPGVNTRGYAMRTKWGTRIQVADADSTLQFGTAMPTADTWSQMALVIDRATTLGSYYLNGSFDASGDLSGIDTLENNRSLYIGAYTATTGEFTGSIALVRIYNKALSALEIQNHFNQEKHLFGVW